MTSTVEIMSADADLFASNCDALVNPVDCTGAMGKGLALEFKRRYPKACAAYRAWAQTGEMTPGRTWFKSACPEVAPSLLVFVTTKNHWRNPSMLVWVESVLTELAARVPRFEIASIGIPALGCGEGRLLWSDVLPLEMAAAERMAAAGVRVLLYPPHESARGRR